MKTTASRALLGIDFAITLFSVFCVGLFLFHDLIWLFVSSFFNKSAEYHAFQVFLVSVVVVIVSLGAILLRELIKVRQP